MSKPIGRVKDKDLMMRVAAHCSLITTTHLQNISPQLAAAQEQDSLLGLVVLLDLVGDDQRKFGNTIDDVS